MFVNYLFLFLMLFSSCSLLEPPKGINTEERFDRERCRVVHCALKKFIKNMKAKGCYAAGIGEGIDHSTGKQNYLGVTFDIEQLPDVEFARKVEIETLNEFLHYINSEEGIQDYVAEYPFPIKFIRVAFISRNPKESLCAVANCREEIYYNQDNPEMPIGPSIEIHSESYEDAIRVLEKK